MGYRFYNFSITAIRSHNQVSAIPSNPYTTFPHPAMVFAISSTSHPHVSPMIPPIRAGQSTFNRSAIFNLKFSCIRHTNHGKYSTTSQGTPHTSVAFGATTPRTVQATAAPVHAEVKLYCVQFPNTHPPVVTAVPSHVTST